MRNPFQIGDTKTHCHTVRPQDSAAFSAGEVHPVYGTFALGREAEWVCRLFVLDMKEEGEEGIGTFLNVRHKSPALVGQEVVFTAYLEMVEGHEVICRYEARVGERLIAEGETGQKILKIEKLERIFAAL